jgi:glycosyltransferase involved in cell wall biosynthesis
MRRVRIVHLVEDLKVGGLERIVELLACKLDKGKYDIQVWCAVRGGPAVDRLVGAGIEVRVLHIHCYHKMQNIFKLAKLFNEVRPDIIHSHTYYVNTLGRLAAKLVGIPILITHIHNVYSRHYTGRNILIERFLSRFTNKIICCSDAVRDFAVQVEKIKEDRLVTIYNGIDLAEVDASGDIDGLRRFMSIHAGTRVIITVASLTEKKGHCYLLEAINLMMKQHENVTSLIVGDGPLRAELEKRARELHIESSVNFCGIRNDIPDLLRMADVFVLPSLKEGLPLCVLEAMACALPVVATDVGGTHEALQNGINGLLVPARNPKALSEAIISLFDNPERLREMGERGYAIYCERFKADVMISLTEALYDDLIEQQLGKNRKSVL